LPLPLWTRFWSSRLPYNTYNRLKAAGRIGRHISVFFCFYATLLFGGVPESFPPITQERENLRADAGMRLPELARFDPRTSPFETQIIPGLSMRGSRRFEPRLDPLGVSRNFELDAKTRRIAVRETLHKLPFRLPYVVSLENYRNERLAYDRRWQWWKVSSEAVHLRDADKRAGPGGLNIDIPVPIKSKAFQSIFGGSSVGLNVQGDISIKGGFRNEKRDEVRTSNLRGASTSFKMDQTQRFTVTGRIGEKVTVNVDQDSERAFDFDNNLKLNYTGFDDEIIQSIEAGNIALTLPGTRFVTFSGKSSGLFGIKSNMQLGNLTLTTVASQEKGENKKLTLSGGSTEDSRRINDYDYRRFAYFFVDEHFREDFKNYSERWQHIASDRTIQDIEVYKSDANYETRYPQSIRGWAVLNPASPDTIETGPETYLGNWIRLEPGVDYYVQKQLGYIVPTNPLNREEVLAVAYRDVRGDTVGNISYSPLSGTTILLRMIKPRNPLPRYQSSRLEWKNVYYLGARRIDKEGFELKLFFKPGAATEPQESQIVEGVSKSYLNIFGLDEVDATGAPNPDNKLDDNDQIINWERGELIFPWIEPFDPDNPDGVFVGGAQQFSELASENRDGTMYDTTSTSLIAQRSKFYLDIKSKNRSANYSLGFNVIENSEKVLLDGRELARDVDYIIDYFSGSLTILNENATSATANVEITYQSNQLFQLEKKTILGTRADYRLSRESFIGGTFLYLNERTLDQRVRIGQGPQQNLIWDINTALRFTPNFLTKAIDALPLISTSEPSSIAFEGEVAEIIPNPNTLNNEGTGDNNGVAYIDDFEAAKRTTPISILRKGWLPASIPSAVERDVSSFQKVVNALSKKGIFNWYNPFNQVPIRDIKPNQDLNANVSNTTQVLDMTFFPAQTDTAGQSWGGIMRALSPGFFDQSESKFLELWIQVDTTWTPENAPRLHIDIGSISEDIIPNTELNTEDLKGGGNIRNGLLDDGEDVGLDGMAGVDPNDYWDINSNGIQDAGEPISSDDFAYASNSLDYSRINGTEGNKLDQGDTGSIRPDTEDSNGNGNVDVTNKYIEYNFDLSVKSDDARRYIRGGDDLSPQQDREWRLYRVPLDDYRRLVGQTQPEFSQIEYIRLWVDGVDRPVGFSIAEINFVGNEWREAGTTQDDSVGAVFQIPSDTTQATLSVAVVNTHDNPEYVAPEGVAGERDRITQVISKEQSLVLLARRMETGNAGIAQKSFPSPLSFINYRRLRMFVYGQDDNNDFIRSDSSSVVFFMRFGADEKNYYEFREYVFPGWDRRNELDIDMLELAALKNTALAQKYNPLSGAELKRIGNQQWRIRGEPSLTTIKLLISGVVHSDSIAVRSGNSTIIRAASPTSFEYNGEIWLDEFRAVDVKKEKGMAYRARADIKLADFIQLGGEVESRDADFHNIAERASTSPTSSFSTRLNANIALDRMLPQSLGLTLPVTVTYSSSTSMPKYIPGKDVETAVLSTAEQQKIRSITDQQGFTISARRRVTSKNWLLRYTIDNVTSNFIYTSNSSSNSTTEFSDRESWSGGLNYALAFGKNNFVSPFWFMKGLPLLGKVGGTKLYYTPQSFDMKFQNNVNQSESKNRSGLSTPSVRTDIYSRDFHSSFKLLEPLTLDLSRGYTYDLQDPSRRATIASKLSKLVAVSPGAITNLNQSFSVKYSPTFFAWLSNNVNYSSSFRYVNNIQQSNSTIGKQASNNTNFSLSGTLRLSQLIKTSGGSQGRRGRTSPTPQNQRQTPEKPSEEEKEEEKKEEGEPNEGAPREQSPQQGQQEDGAEKPTDAPSGGATPSGRARAQSKTDDADGGGGSILNTLSKALGKFRDISFNYTERKTVSNFGLGPGLPSWRYQFGLDMDTTGVATVAGLATNPKTFSVGESYSAQSGLALSNNIGIDMRFSYDTQENQSTTITGNTAISALGKGAPFPEMTLNLSGLEKIPFFKKVANTVSFSSNFSAQYKTTWVDNPNNKNSEDETKSFRPLAKVNINWKNSMVSSVQYNSAASLKTTLDARSQQILGKTETSTSDLTVSHTYSKRSGFRIPIWFLKNKELKNSIDLSISFTSRKSVTKAARGNSKLEDVDNTSSWSFEPKMTYSFSTRVRGGAHFTIGKNSSLRAGDTSIKELGIDVNISIRGN